MGAKESEAKASKAAAAAKPSAAKPPKKAPVAKKPARDVAEAGAVESKKKPVPKKAAPEKVEKPTAEKPAEKPMAEKHVVEKHMAEKHVVEKPVAAPKKAPAKPAAKAPEKPPAKPARPAAALPVSDDDFDSRDDDDEEDEEEEEAEEPDPDVVAALVEAVAKGEPMAATRDDEVGADGEKKAKKVVKVPPMPPRRADGTITVAYSPDADDAFMYYALEGGKVDVEDRKYETFRADVQSLNEEAKKGTHDVTALSFGAYPHVYERYLLLPCGSSFGDNQGPILVAKSPVRPAEVNGLVVAVPGPTTTATLALRLWLPRANLKLVPAPFDQIGALVKSGRVRAGLLIHEGQLTWREEGLVRITDFGQWWSEKTEGLPLPLGANAIRRDIPPELRTKIALDIKRSIAYALGHREEALAYATKFARGMDKAKVDKYVGMYVNELTLDLGERGKQAARMLLDEAYRHGFIPRTVDLDFE